MVVCTRMAVVAVVRLLDKSLKAESAISFAGRQDVVCERR